MDSLAHYSLPIGGMELGLHRFDFQIDSYFVAQFENYPYGQTDVQVTVEADRDMTMIPLKIEMSGLVTCSCDRCGVDIRLPVQTRYHVVLKEGLTESSEENDEVIMIRPGEHRWSVAGLLYDVLLLAMPMKKTYDCKKDQSPPCDQKVLHRLEGGFDQRPTGAEEDSVWEQIRKKINP